MRVKTKHLLIFLFPSVIGLLLFYIIPFILGLKFCFFKGNSFLGLSGIIDTLKNEMFLLGSFNTILMAILNVPFLVVLSFLMALLVYNLKDRFKWIKNTLFLPYVIPSAAAVLFFSMLFDFSGPLNWILSVFNINQVPWLFSNLMRVPVMLLYIWRNVGFNMIIFLAELNNIPKEIIDASEIDGANWRQKSFKIIMPMMAPVTLFVTILSFIQSQNVFKEAWILGSAYPDRSIYTIQHFILNQFNNMNYTAVSTSSYLFAIIVYLLIALLFKLQKRWAY